MTNNETRKEIWRERCRSRGLTIMAWWWFTIGQRNVRGVYIDDGSKYGVACDQERHLDAVAAGETA